MIGLLVLFALAGALSALWLGGAVVYATGTVGWDTLAQLPPSELALFVIGVFGPPAALWLIIALVRAAMRSDRQDRILRAMAAQARSAAGQIEAQVRTLIQMQEESRRRVMSDGMDLVIKDLNGQAAVLAERLGMVSQDEADTLWARTVSGDVWAFAYAFLTRAAAYPEFPDMLAERLSQDDISSSALQMFLRRYDQLVDSFKENDADKLARSVLEDGPLARLQGLFETVNARAIGMRQAREGDARQILEDVGRHLDEVEERQSARFEKLDDEPVETAEGAPFTPLRPAGESFDEALDRLEETLATLQTPPPGREPPKAAQESAFEPIAPDDFGPEAGPVGEDKGDPRRAEAPPNPQGDLWNRLDDSPGPGDRAR